MKNGFSKNVLKLMLKKFQLKVFTKLWAIAEKYPKNWNLLLYLLFSVTNSGKKNWNSEISQLNEKPVKQKCALTNAEKHLSESFYLIINYIGVISKIISSLEAPLGVNYVREIIDLPETTNVEKSESVSNCIHFPPP